VLSAPPPDSKRIPGAPGLTPNDNLVVR
jgi:hypothetical protein